MVGPASEAERRRAIARRVAGHLAAHTALRASMLTGSAAQGTSDEHSDVDLLNYYDELPEPASFDELMADLGAERIGDVIPGEAGYAARYWIEGIEVETGAQLVSGVERRLERLGQGDVDWITAKVLSGLLEGLPLHGEKLIRDWQELARAYPDSLRRREVEANLGFFLIWEIDGRLAARDAELFRRQMLLDGAFRVVAVLSALNRLYFTTFQFKRVGAHAKGMALKPDRLAERLDRIANASPSEAAEELRSLVDETKAIVRAEMPDVDVDARWRPVP